jgi:hypothetical protein
VYTLQPTAREQQSLPTITADRRHSSLIGTANGAVISGVAASTQHTTSNREVRCVCNTLSFFCKYCIVLVCMQLLVLSICDTDKVYSSVFACTAIVVRVIIELGSGRITAFSV